MHTVGLIGDTHGYMDDRIIHHLAECDEVWHTGDWGPQPVESKLIELGKPLKGVYGNIDDPKLRYDYPEFLHFTYQGIKVLMIHIAGPFGRYSPRLQEILRTHRANILLCGHSHILKVQYDKAKQFMYINPGAAGLHGFHKMRTMMKLRFDHNKLIDIQVVELGPRVKEGTIDETQDLLDAQ